MDQCSAIQGEILAPVLKNTLKLFTNVSLHVPSKTFADVNLVLLDTPVSFPTIRFISCEKSF